jgi:hypothetical protein
VRHQAAALFAPDALFYGTQYALAQKLFEERL